MTTLTGAGTYKRQRYLSTGKTALKTIEEKDVNESGISNSLHRSLYENQNNVVNESGILKNIK